MGNHLVVLSRLLGRSFVDGIYLDGDQAQRMQEKTILKVSIVGKLILIWAFCYLISGCGAAWFSAKTESCYEAGQVKLCYQSSKNQENFKGKVGFNLDGTIKDLEIQTTSTTAESATAAASASVAAMADALIKLIPLIEKAAAMGGS